MYVRGRGVEFATVAAIVRKVSAEKYDGNVTVHQDAKPIRATGGTIAVAYLPGDESFPYVSAVNGYGYQGRIWVESSRGTGARRSWSGRRMRAACWHANRDVMRAIFEKYPHAVITTAIARYEGAAGFERVYPQTANKNIGSQIQPAYMPDLCECDDNE